MPRSALPALALLCATLAATPAAARVQHDPCPGTGDWIGTQDVTGYSYGYIAKHTNRYLACSPVVSLPHILLPPTWLGSTLKEAFDLKPTECRYGFKLAGTHKFSWHAHNASWDFWAQNGEWVIWTGHGHWLTPYPGHFATGYEARFTNWNLGKSWPIRLFMHCVKESDG